MMKPGRDIAGLLAIMAALRTPGTGCPWDLEQTFATIAPYTIEEAYEVADAIARGDIEDLRDELGDLLLQVVFHARMAEEEGQFDFGGVVQAITEKLIRRHPHVFGDLSGLSVGEVAGLWQRIKAEEKARKRDRAEAEAEAEAPATPVRAATLAGVPVALPALTRALKLQTKAAAVGFDWGDVGPVLAKIQEEAAELAEVAGGGNPERTAEELGDLLFAAVNLARHLGVDPEAALAATSRKFERRFAAIEDALAQTGRVPAESSLAEMDRLWDAAKRAERDNEGSG